MKKFASLLLVLVLLLAIPAQAAARSATASAKGFAGEVAVTLSADEKGRIVSLVIGDEKFNEIPGLGARALEPEFAAQFVGKALPVSLNDIDALTSATYTTKAVIEAVNKAWELIETSEDTPSPVFTFRNGVHWGMSLEEVKALEGAEGETRELNNWFGLGYESVNVSRYQADALGYLFFGGQLNMIIYDFRQLEASDALYLKGALSSLYGEMQENAEDALCKLLDYVSTDHASIDSAVRWETADTQIFLMENTSECGILYAPLDLDSAIIGLYDTYGL